MNPEQKALLEKRDGWDVGRDPRRVSRDELIAAGHNPISALKALRLRCIDCCADQANEVRLCTAVSLPELAVPHGLEPVAQGAERCAAGSTTDRRAPDWPVARETQSNVLGKRPLSRHLPALPLPAGE